MIGTRIGRYQIVDEIGGGGMGVVFRATQTTLNRTVAIKMLRHQFAGLQEYLARFRREAEMLARLAHDGIVHIYDIEELDGDHFIIMEYAGGPSLKSLIAHRGRLDPSCARDIAVLVADALGAAHRQGIIHRDVKPDNILFSAAGRPKLTDFGIACIAQGQAKLSHTGLLLGTAHYVSPEQARGRPLTAASDIYSLGVVLYEMLSGQLPFDGEDHLAVAIKHVSDDPPPLAHVAPDVPDEMCRIVHRAMEKDPEDRFGSAEELRESLTALDLGIPSGRALRLEISAQGEIDGASACPECGERLRAGFLTCPGCGLAVRRHCTQCGTTYDPVSPECPFCRVPASARHSSIPAVAEIRPPEGGRAWAAGSSRIEARVEAPRRQRAGAPAPEVARAPPRIADVLATARRRLGAVPRLVNPLWVGTGLLGSVLLFAVAQGTMYSGAATATGRSGPGPEAGDTIVPAPNPPEPTPRPPPPGGSAGSEGTGSAPTSGSSGDGPTAATGTAQASESSRASDVPGSAGIRSTRAAARPPILAIIARHQKAAVTDDLDAQRADMSPDAAKAWTPYLPTLQMARDVRSSVGDVRIDVRDETHATATFWLTIAGARRSDGVRATLWEGDVEWRLAYLDGRWLITSASTR